MRGLRWFASGLLLTALLAVAVWLSAPWWLARLAAHEIASQGFEPLAVSIGQVGLHRSVIAQLRLRQPGSGLQMTADNVALSYRIPALIDGHLDGISLQSMDVSLRATGSAGAGGGMLLSPAALFAAMPAGRIEIGHISLRWLDADGRVVQAFAGQARYAGDAMHLQLGEAAADGLQLDMMLDQAGHCSLRLAQAGKRIADATCSIGAQGDPSRVQGSLDVDLEGLDSLLARWVSLPPHTVGGHLTADWTAHMPGQWDAGWLRETRVSAQLGLSADMQAAGEGMQAALKGSVNLAGGKGIWRLADDSALAIGGLRIGFTNLGGAFETGGMPSLDVNGGGSLHLQDVAVGGLRAGRVDVDLPAPVQLDAGNTGWRLARPADLSLHAGGLSLDGNKAAFDKVIVHLKAGRLIEPAGSLTLAGLRVGTAASGLSGAGVDADFSLAGDALSASGKLSVGGTARLDWRLTQDVANGEGKLDYTLVPLQFPADGPVLAHLAGQADSLALQAGSLAGQGALRWGGKRPFSGKLRFALQAVKGSYRETGFTGLGGNVDVGVDTRGLDFSSPKLTAQTLDTGLLLSHLGTKARLYVPYKGKPRMKLTGLRAETLDGEIASDAIDIDLARKSNPFVVRLSHIDVKKLVDFRKQEGLSADGLLDGTLPFDWTDKGLTMTAGTLDARAPGGAIRYLGSSSVQHFAASDPAAGLAMQVLNDFQYRVLNARADYRPDGEMKLHIALKGHNPGYDNGRPINFNLNVQENVLKLLKSLRMADEISRRVEERLQKDLRKK